MVAVDVRRKQGVNCVKLWETDCLREACQVAREGRTNWPGKNSRRGIGEQGCNVSEMRSQMMGGSRAGAYGGSLTKGNVVGDGATAARKSVGRDKEGRPIRYRKPNEWGDEGHW